MSQSDSPTPTSHDPRSLTDLWRDVTKAHGEHAQAAAVRAFGRRLDDIAARHDQTEIADHAQLEHPHLPWNDQAAVFTTGEFAERAR
jgi:hypothetical protein